MNRPQPAASGEDALRIREVRAYPLSFPIAPEDTVYLGMGRAVKKDAVLVKVTTESGLVGWGEAHHGKAHVAVATLINTTLRQLVVGMDASDVVGVWDRIYWKQLASHGVGAGCAMAMSGIDLALWDIRGKAVGWPLWKLLGGRRRPVPAYAGGVSLGFQAPQALVEEARVHVEAGYRAVKLRVGDNPQRDLERVAAVRAAFGAELAIMVDANTGYRLADARRAMPGFDELDVGWLEEPFAPHDHASYRQAASYGRVPLAAGENHFTRYEFNRVIEDRAITILQPDLSKAGGLTELLRIAALASAWKLPIHPHTCMTGVNMAASVHLLAAIDNGGYFEADVSRKNLFRDRLTSEPFRIDREGCVLPLEAPGIGVEVDEAFIEAHPAIEGPNYV